jgi:Ran GTPase-activating protein (RanGAP) involved in mRNA processing and transport
VNKTLQVLKLENNQIAPAGIKALAESLESNTSLKELKISNQKALAGTDAEQALARAMSLNQRFFFLICISFCSYF